MHLDSRVGCWVVDAFSIKIGEVTLYFGEDSLAELKRYLSESELVCIVTGKSSAEVSGALGDSVRLLEELGIKYVVYRGIKPNPSSDQVSDLARFMWEHGVDAVLAIGGGSVIDAAKVASAVAAGGGRVDEYMDGTRKPELVLPLYAVNITHGTGTEVDRYAVVTVGKIKYGRAICYPVASVDDPKYTLTLPKSQTLYTALDTFYHAYESATVGKSRSPYVRLLAGEAIKLVKDWLSKVLSNLRDLEGRYWLLYASMLAGIAIDTASTHIVHAIEHALSGMKPELAHGAGLAMIGPRAVYYIHKASPEHSASALKPIVPDIKASPEDAEKASRAVEEFQRSLGFEERLSDYGFGKDDVEEVVKLVLGPLKYMSDETPFPVTEEIVKDIYLRSL